jgi:hypothetical protein
MSVRPPRMKLRGELSMLTSSSRTKCRWQQTQYRQRPNYVLSRSRPLVRMSSTFAACERNGIVVSNIRDYAIHTVPEHTFALILALRRSLIPYREAEKLRVTYRSKLASLYCALPAPLSCGSHRDCGVSNISARHFRQARTVLRRASLPYTLNRQSLMESASRFTVSPVLTTNINRRAAPDDDRFGTDP